MSAQDVQSLIDEALTEIVGATVMVTYVQKNGTDPSKWPTTTSMGRAAIDLLAARAKAASLVSPAPPSAAFNYTEG